MAWPMPDARHFILCRRLVPDPRMAQPSLVHLMHVVRGSAGGFVFDELHLLAQLTNGHGRYGLTIDLVRLDDDEVVARAAEVVLELDHRLAVYNFHRRMRTVPFEQPGVYEFRLYARMFSGPGAGTPQASGFRLVAAVPLRVEGVS